MKNYLILLIILQLLIIKGAGDEDEDIYYDINEYSQIFKGKCEDDKAKTGACMYSIYDLENDRIKEFALFDKCGKGKYCSMIGDDDEGYGQCLEKFEFRKNDKSCNYDKDCESNSCVNNKCSYASEGAVCETTHGEILCKPGLTCITTSESEKKKCYKLSKENEEAKYGCWNGLKVDKDGKCKKYGTLEDGEKAPYEGSYIRTELLCKSGYCKGKIDDNGDSYCLCVSLTTEPTCSKGKVTSKGEWSNKDEITVNSDSKYDFDYNCKAARDYSGTVKYYYRFSKLQSKLYQDFLEDYNELDLEEINSDDKYAGDFLSSLKWKTKEKWIIYKNAPDLYAAGLIDSEGKKNDDKKCEYEYIIKDLKSNYIKIKELIIFMIALLF